MIFANLTDFGDDMAHILICDNNAVFTAYLKDEIATLFPDRFTISVCWSAQTLRAEAAR